MLARPEGTPAHGIVRQVEWSKAKNGFVGHLLMLPRRRACRQEDDIVRAEPYGVAARELHQGVDNDAVLGAAQGRGTKNDPRMRCLRPDPIIAERAEVAHIPGDERTSGGRRMVELSHV